MPTHAPTPSPLQDWTVVSLRPRGQHASLRTAAARYGARTLAMSPFLIEPRDDAATRAAVRQALRARIVIYTSPNAVVATAALHPLGSRRGQAVLAVGSATMRALLRHGVTARAPQRMDSEGLLAMPELANVAQHRIGLITGAGGRGMLVPALRKRGAEVVRVDVYARAALTPSAGMLEKLQAALADPNRVLLPLSSGEALQHVLSTLPASLRRHFTRIAVVAASARLADVARDAGFRRLTVATDARPASLLRAATGAFG